MPSYESGWSAEVSPDEFIKRIGLDKKIRGALRVGAEHFSTTWTRVLKRPGSGRTYAADITFRTFGGRVVPMKREAVGEQDRTAAHQASAPGEPPATDSGVLSNSIAVEEISDFEHRVGSPLDVARWLHFGVTDHPGGITIAPRPHGDIALEEARDGMTKKVAEALVLGRIALQIRRSGG